MMKRYCISIFESSAGTSFQTCAHIYNLQNTNSRKTIQMKCSPKHTSPISYPLPAQVSKLVTFHLFFPPLQYSPSEVSALKKKSSYKRESCRNDIIKI